MRRVTAADQPHPDQVLVDEVLAGSTPAWQSLVERYSGLAYSVARRHLHDHDDARDVVVEVFERLYHGQLQRYDGRAALSTWMVLVVRNAAIDHLRHLHGRQRLPVAVRRRSPLDQRVFELFFVQGWPADVAVAQLGSEGWELSPTAFWDLVSDLEADVDPRFSRRLQYERAANQRGAASGRWLEYMEHVRHEQQPAAPDPAEPAADPTARIQAELARLSEDERHALDLRYQQSLSAREIAGRMDLRDQRQAFTLLDRAVRKLRRALSTPTPLTGLEGEP